MKRGHLVFSPREKEAMEHHQIAGSRHKHPRDDEGLHALWDFTPVDEGVVKSSNTSPIRHQDERTNDVGKPEHGTSVHSLSPRAFAAVRLRNGV